MNTRETILCIAQLDPGDENCENFAFVPYPHLTPTGDLHIPPSTAPIRLRDVEERTGGIATFSCSCGTVLEFDIPLDSDLEG